MEASQDRPAEAPAEKTKETPEAVSGPTAKELAAAEEANQSRLLKLAAQANAPDPDPPVNIAEVASRGYDALQEQFRRHNENVAKKKEYVPPPRTSNQMSRLQEELEAGARAVAKNQERQAAARPEPTDLRKEGFTTPVYRPDNLVPDPTIPATSGPGGLSAAGTREYGPDV